MALRYPDLLYHFNKRIFPTTLNVEVKENPAIVLSGDSPATLNVHICDTMQNSSRDS